MLSIFKKQHGMNIIGSGGMIILFTLPFLLLALYLQFYLPRIAALPVGLGYLIPIGYILLVIGLFFWGIAVLQLISGFSQGNLITTSAYSIVRNPIYASMIWLVLPAVSFITQTWIYLAVSVFIYLGVMLFIRKEEKRLLAAFGKEYEDYLKRVHRLIPFVKP